MYCLKTTKYNSNYTSDIELTLNYKANRQSS